MVPMNLSEGPSWSWSYGSWIYNHLCNQYLSPLMLWVRIPFMARCRTLCDQRLATGLGFSTGIPVSSTNKTDRHDITEILLKAVLRNITITLYSQSIKKNIWKMCSFRISICLCLNQKFSGIISYIMQFRNFTCAKIS